MRKSLKYSAIWEMMKNCTNDSIDSQDKAVEMEFFNQIAKQAEDIEEFFEKKLGEWNSEDDKKIRNMIEDLDQLYIEWATNEKIIGFIEGYKFGISFMLEIMK